MPLFPRGWLIKQAGKAVDRTFDREAAGWIKAFFWFWVILALAAGVGVGIGFGAFRFVDVCLNVGALVFLSSLVSVLIAAPRKLQVRRSSLSLQPRTWGFLLALSWVLICINFLPKRQPLVDVVAVYRMGWCRASLLELLPVFPALVVLGLSALVCERWQRRDPAAPSGTVEQLLELDQRIRVLAAQRDAAEQRGDMAARAEAQSDGEIVAELRAQTLATLSEMQRLSYERAREKKKSAGS